jgi:hypothetical protein
MLMQGKPHLWQYHGCLIALSSIYKAHTLLLGQSNTCDLKQDTDGGGIAIGTNKAGQKFQLGCDVVAGDDDWISPQLFEYDPDSNIEVTIRKYGGLRDGHASFSETQPRT